MTNKITTYLMGDKTSLDKALKSSQQSVNDYAKYIKGALIGIGGALAVKELFSFGSSMISLYNTQAAAEAKLAGVIKATGGAAGYTLEQFKAMASQMQETHGVGDEVILNAQAMLATFKNIKGDVFRDATAAMLDMSAVMDGDLKGASVQLGKALNDPITGMSALSKVGVTFSDQQKAMIQVLQESGDMMGAQRIILNELASEFGGGAAAKAATFEGQMTKLWNRIGDVGEAIGAALVPAISALFPVIDTAVTFIANIAAKLGETSQAAADWSLSFGEYFKAGFEYVVGIAADAWSVMEFLYTNFSAMMERQTYAWLLSVTTSFEDLKHLFTATAPAYIQWFFDNWRNLLMDYQNFQAAVYINMFRNIVQFFKGVQSWLTGGEGGFEFVALTDGFQSTLSKLPEIAARTKSETEQYLEGSIKQMDEMIGNSWDETFKKNRAIVEGLFESPIPIEVGEPTLDTAAFDEAAKKVEEETKGLEEVKEAVQESTSAGGMSGLEELAKNVQTAAIKGREEAAKKEQKLNKDDEKKAKEADEKKKLLDQAQGKADPMDAINNAKTFGERREAMQALAREQQEAQKQAMLEAREKQKADRKAAFNFRRGIVEADMPNGDKGAVAGGSGDKVVEALSKIAPADNAPVVDVLNQIKEFYPVLIRKLGMGGLT